MPGDYDFCDLPPCEMRVYQPNAEHDEPPDNPPHILAAYFDTADYSLNMAGVDLRWIKFRPRLPLILTRYHVIPENEQDMIPSIRIGDGGTIRISGGYLRIG